MSDLELSFPDQDPANAGRLAQDVRAALIAAGVPTADVALKRERTDTMNAGDIVQLAFEYLKTGVDLATVALAIYHLVAIRERGGLRIKMPDGAVMDIQAQDMTPGQIRAVLSGVKGAGSPRA